MTLAQLRRPNVRVRTLVQLETRLLKIPRGTLLRVVGKMNGLELETDPCGCCGVAVRITHVPARDVDLVLLTDEQLHGSDPDQLLLDAVHAAGGVCPPADVLAQLARDVGTEVEAVRKRIRQLVGV